jgi:D-alanyl-D-alanine carboxypeptidase (penicillin-binding protein 5/6)
VASSGGRRADHPHRLRSWLRLSTALVFLTLALALFAVTRDTPASDHGVATTTLTSPTIAEAPVVPATATLVVDASTGRLLAGHAAHERRQIASLTKLMTAYVVMQAGDPERRVIVPQQPVGTDESNIELNPGTHWPRDVLLRAMLIVSANDAARALALDVGGTEARFVELMNAAAADLGLRDTNFVNPVGLDDPQQYSSAADLASLSLALMADGDFAATVKRTSAKLHGRDYASTNDLLSSYTGADGIKTGHTEEAGWCLVASATRDGRRVLVVVLGAPSSTDRDAAATTLLDWGFAHL